MTQETSEDRSRMERRRGSRSMRRAAMAAAVLVAVAALGATVYGLIAARQAAEERPPSTVVVIAESELEDGTIVAGLAVVLETPAADSNGPALRVTPVDTLEAADIPGTSFGTLRDALALGGPELVARIAAKEAADGRRGDDEPACLVLDEDAWGMLIDNAGGASVTLAGSTTVFTGERLYRFAEGTRTLTGEESVALLRGSETLSGGDKGSSARRELAEELAKAVLSDPAYTATLVDENQAECSVEPESLAAFLGSRNGK